MPVRDGPLQRLKIKFAEPCWSPLQKLIQSCNRIRLLGLPMYICEGFPPGRGADGASSAIARAPLSTASSTSGTEALKSTVHGLKDVMADAGGV